MVGFAFMYNTFYSVVILIWVCISCYTLDIQWFSKLTYYLFLPIQILNILQYLVVNIDMLVPMNFMQDNSNLKYGFITF